MKKSFSRHEANVLAREIFGELSRDVEVRCDFEEIEAFVLEAKPAVLIFDWKGTEYAQLATLFHQLPFPSLSITAKESGTGHCFYILINVEAVQRRVKREPLFAGQVGWNHGLTADENLSKIFDRESFIGFVLGFPEQAIRDYQEKNRRVIYIPFTRFAIVRFLNWVLYECQKQRQHRRQVDIRNPDGYPVYSWIAFGDQPDPEEVAIAEHVSEAYSRD